MCKTVNCYYIHNTLLPYSNFRPQGPNSLDCITFKLVQHMPLRIPCDKYILLAQYILINFTKYCDVLYFYFYVVSKNSLCIIK